MQGLIFVLISTLLIIKPTANGMFLGLYGVEALPLVYIMTALLAVIVSVVYSYFISGTSVYGLFRSILTFCIVFLIIVGILLELGFFIGPILYIFYLFVAIFGILSASQFWLMANQIFNTREAKKYFGWIGSGAIAGGISGGYIASIFSDLIGAERLVYIAALALMGALYILSKLLIYIPEDTDDDKIESFDIIKSFSLPLHLIFSSKHLSFLAVIIAFSVFTAKLIDYQFGYFATKNFFSDDELTSFFGFWYSSFNIISLLIQMFVTQRVVGRLGVGMSLFILPVLLLFNAAFLLIFPTLILALGMKLLDGGLKQSINKAAVELLSIPISDPVKLKTKTFLDVFVDSLATGISGLFLIIVVKTLDLPNFIVTGIMIGSILLWIYFVSRIKQEYKNTFRLSLKLKSDQIEATEQLNIVNQFITVLKKGDEYQILKLLKKVEHLYYPDLEETVLKLVDHPSDKIKVAAINYLNLKAHNFSDQILPLIDHEDQNIKVAAFEYLLNHDQKLEPNYFLNKINDEDIKVQSAALVAIAKEYANQTGVEKMLRLSDRVSLLREKLKNENEPNVRILVTAAMKIVGYGKLSDHYDLIKEYLSSPDGKLQRQAILAVGLSQSRRLLNTMIFNTDIKESNQDALAKSLSHFSEGQLEVILKKAVESGKTELITSIAQAFSEKPSIESVESLLKLADHEKFLVRTKAIESLSILADRYPLLEIDPKKIHSLLLFEAKDYEKMISLLKNIRSTELDMPLPNLRHDASESYQKLITLLEKKVNDSLKRIFELLHIKYAPEDLIELYGYVLSNDTTLRHNALEFLESILNDELKSKIVPLIEFNVLYPHIEPSQKNNTIEIEEVLSDLYQSEDLQIRKAARQLSAYI